MMKRNLSAALLVLSGCFLCVLAKSGQMAIDKNCESATIQAARSSELRAACMIRHERIFRHSLRPRRGSAAISPEPAGGGPGQVRRKQS